VLTGLAAVGAAAPSDAPVREAVDWIFSCQNDDGGWGETAASYDDPALAGRGPSSVTVTGAVLWALSAVGHAHTPAAARAARHLVERQAPDGSWSDRHCYGVVFPGLYHYYNDTFPTYLALEGLGAWSAALGPRAG
jgi:squalene-hopene/tetraprenyl-beta-curcumene cyclase